MSSSSVNMALTIRTEASLKSGMINVGAFLNIGQVNIQCCSYQFMDALVKSKCPEDTLINLCNDIVQSFTERFDSDYANVRKEIVKNLYDKLIDMFGIDLNSARSKG